MADTVREQIIDAMVTRFQGIRKISGYKSDLGLNVNHLRDSNFELNELPALNIRDQANSIEHFTARLFNNALDIEIDVKVASGETTFDDAYDLIGDVYKAIAVDDTWGGLAVDTLPVSDEIEHGHAENVAAGITIRIQVHYEATKWTF